MGLTPAMDTAGERVFTLSYRMSPGCHTGTKERLERQEWVDRKGHGVPSVALARPGQPWGIFCL